MVNASVYSRHTFRGILFIILLASIGCNWGSPNTPRNLPPADSGINGVQTNVQKILPSDLTTLNTHDRFGSAIAIQGDTAVIGAPGLLDSDTGTVYIFTRSANTWTQTAELSASDGQGGDAFGRSVAISGDTIIVGASNVSSPSASYSGAAYIFTRSAESWSSQTETAKLSPSDPGMFNSFGASVAIEGNTAVVGAPGVLLFGVNSGAVYIFTRSGTQWTSQTETMKLTPSDPEPSNGFGRVALSGNTLVVGAPGKDIAGMPISNIGTAYIFTRSGSTWTQSAQLSASNAERLSYFGYNVAIDGNTVVIGSNQHRDILSPSITTYKRSAYIFTRSGATWTNQTETAILSPSDGTEGDGFGGSVAISGDTVVVSASASRSSTARNGSAYIFTRKGEEWSSQTETTKLVPSNTTEQNWFGSPLAIESETIIVGEILGDISNGSTRTENTGAAYFFHLRNPRKP